MTSICTVTTLRAPLHETMMFVSYHLKLGVDHMYLFFDDPADPAPGVLAGRERLTCIRCDADYWSTFASASQLSINDRQRVNAGAALALARQAEMDWIIHIDSDELIFAEEPLKTMLSGSPSDAEVLKFPTLEAVVDRYEYERVFEQVSIFKVCHGVVGRKLVVSPEERRRIASQRRSFNRRVFLARLLGCSISKNTFLRGHRAGKSAVRTGASVDVIDCHEPVPCPGKTLRARVVDGAWLLHFECRGLSSWQQKWLDLLKPGVQLNKHRRRMVQRFKTVYDRRGRNALPALYRRLYFLSDYERSILSRLGLLRPLRLDPRRFEEQDAVLASEEGEPG